MKNGVVLPGQLPQSFRDLFIHASRFKKEKMVLDNLRPLTETSGQIPPSRWLDVWNVKDDKNQYPAALGVPPMLHAKSRWIL
eukprot:3355788-Amphidinium_carterae.1